MNFDQSQTVLAQVGAPPGSVCLLYSPGLLSGGTYLWLAKEQEPSAFVDTDPECLQTLRLDVYRKLLAHIEGRLVLLIRLPVAGQELMEGSRALTDAELADVAWLSLPGAFQPLWCTPGIQQALTRKPARLVVGICLVTKRQVVVSIDTTGRAGNLIASLGDRPRSSGR